MAFPQQPNITHYKKGKAPSRRKKPYLSQLCGMERKNKVGGGALSSSSTGIPFKRAARVKEKQVYRHRLLITVLL